MNDETYLDRKVKCPYCGFTYNVEAEDMSRLLGGEEESCDKCEKVYFVQGEATPHFWTEKVAGEAV